MLTLGIITLLIFIGWLTEGHVCPLCKEHSGVTTEKDECGEFRRCINCEHFGYAYNHEIKKEGRNECN